MDEIQIRELRNKDLLRNIQVVEGDMREWRDVTKVKDREEIEKRSGMKCSPLIKLRYANFLKLLALDPMHLIAGNFWFLYFMLLVDAYTSSQMYAGTRYMDINVDISIDR